LEESGGGGRGRFPGAPHHFKKKHRKRERAMNISSTPSALTEDRALVSLISFVAFQTVFLFFSSRRRHTRFKCDWSSDVCSSDLIASLKFDAAKLIFFHQEYG